MPYSCNTCGKTHETEEICDKPKYDINERLNAVELRLSKLEQFNFHGKEQPTVTAWDKLKYPHNVGETSSGECTYSTSSNTLKDEPIFRPFTKIP